MLNEESYLPISALSATAVAIIKSMDKGLGKLLLHEVDNMNLDQKGALVAMLNICLPKINR